MGNVLEIKDFNFEEEVLLAEELVIVEFFALWCAPCRMIAPVLEEISQEYQGKVKVVKVNIDENSLTAANYKILSIPAILFFKNGEIKETIIGYQGKEALTAKVDELI